MSYAALAISVFALAFTVTNFWWLHARRGKLTAPTPRTYAFVERVRLRLPLAIYNTGAAALIVTDLRLLIDDLQEPLRWITTRAVLRPGSDDGHAFATPFVVQGRSTREVIVEFGTDVAWRPPPASLHGVRLQARVHPAEHWVNVASFPWWAPPPGAATGHYIAYRNEPAADG
jgi:hypothetical protein